MKIILLSMAIYSLNMEASTAANIDEKLNHYIREFHLLSPHDDTKLVRPLYELGRQLFHAKSLSLVGDISCAHCHNDARGTSDGLPFSIGTGANGAILTRIQGNAKTTPRHSPTLWNRSTKNNTIQFWDGRVSFHRSGSGKTYIDSPSKALNGIKPILSSITKQLESAAAVQAIFPPTSTVEMRGDMLLGESDKTIWDTITKNVLNDPTTDMRTMFMLAFPGTLEKDINMGHIGKAIAHFEEIKYFVNDTPWDNYVAGDTKALSPKGKRGALLFVEKANCASCHHGERFTNHSFENTLIPNIGLGSAPQDLGRFDVSKMSLDKYAFSVSTLRNVALSAPYMHNGSLATLEDVVEHYNQPMRTLMHFDIEKINKTYGRFYNEKFVQDTNRDNLRDQYKHRSQILKMDLNLTSSEKSDLVHFLRTSLTSNYFFKR